jgi:acyl transferase domain-containing protein/short-subunit dehydrogenase/acyl carrier protein
MELTTSTQMQRTSSSSMTRIDREPIAIIGIGCRFPGGANNPSAFWDLVIKGKDAIVEVPADRWDICRFYHPDPNKPGKMYTQYGGFLQEQIDQFDALFFGISPREAACMDPQQRVLLEVVWEALEDAGLVPEQLAGSDTGVYIGAFMLDNALTQMSSANRNMIGTHTPFSATMTMLSNRISYLLDLHGPSVTIDTACSSSLVAFHFACQALWRGECSLGLVGGVNIMHRPETTITMCKGQFLAPDGHCKSFDERADGYARGEGAGIVVLKPLSAAQRDGDNIYALVRGTGVNQDGRTDGISVPNPESQESLIQKVCAQADIRPERIRYVEAHGTGTSVGDPIEARALGAVFGKGRSGDTACVVGSVKANIGHLEAAAGIAGLIKATLCLKHQQIPPLANLQNPNPSIPFKDLGLRLPTAAEPMSRGKDPALVGINSFGYGGTNAHAILEASPDPEQSPGAQTIESSSPYVLPISARSEQALQELAKQYAQKLCATSSPSLHDFCFSASTRRAHHNHRLVTVADSSEAMVKKLHTFVEHGRSEKVSVGAAIEGSRPVFVFTGMGPQWWGMGHELFGKSAVFREEVERCDEIFKAVAGWSILEEMLKDESPSRMSETQIAQPANFMLQNGLVAMWRDMGIQPAAVMGHSVGEVTAAYVAGVLSLEDTIRVSYHRSRVQKKAAGLGGMLAVALSEEEVQTMLIGYDGQVSIAAANSPVSVTLSGAEQPLQDIAQKLEAQGIFNRFLQVEVAYHSQYMDSLKDELIDSLQGLRPQLPTLPLYSTVTGRLVEAITYDEKYWAQNMRQPVCFATAMENAIDHGHRVFLQVGPHPVLSTPIKECMLKKAVQGAAVPSLRRGQPERRTLLEALGKLYILGYPVDWQRVYPQGGTYVHITTYPWQRQTYWHESAESLSDRVGDPSHPLLGRRLNTPVPTWENDFNAYALRYLDDHRVEGLTVLPGAAYVELALAIHGRLVGDQSCVLENVNFSKVFLLENHDDRIVQVRYDRRSHEYHVYSRTSKEDNGWQLHASGTLSMASLTQPACIDYQVIRERCCESFDAEEHYEWMNRRGLSYGPYFQAVKRIWRRPDRREVMAEIETREPFISAEHEYRLHPVLLDACFQAMLAVQEDNEAYVPVSIRQVRFHRRPKRRFLCHGVRTGNAEDAIDGDIALLDETGDVLVELRGIHAPILSKRTGRERENSADWLYRFKWQIADSPKQGSASGGWLLFQDERAVGEQLAEQLHALGMDPVIEVFAGERYEQEGTHRFRVPRGDKAAMRKLFDDVDINRCQQAVYLWGLDAPVEENDPVGTSDVVSCLDVVQLLRDEIDSEAPHLFVVTCGAQSVDSHGQAVAVAQAPVVGMLQVAINEYPDCRFSLVDLDPNQDGQHVEPLVAELLANDREEEVVLRGEDRFVHRLIRMSADAFDQASIEHRAMHISKDTPYRLELAESGSIDDLSLREIRKPELEPGEVEIEVRTVAVNQKDVLKVRRMLTEAELKGTYYQNKLGMEAAGTVVGVGEGISELAVGDAIVVCVLDSFRNQLKLRINDGFWVSKPKHLSFEQCVGMPIAFATAYYALHQVAGITTGERVLIHGATDSVGLAVIQIAQWLGAIVYATCGNDEEQAYLHMLGVEKVFYSGSVELADKIIGISDSEGVDIILNTLPLEVAERSFSLLAPFGRFIQIGGHNAAANNRSPMLSSNKNFVFAAVDIDRIMAQRPELFRKLLAEVWERFEAGDFTPLPVQVFPVTEVAKAFRCVEESGVIGKAVVSLRANQELPLIPMAPERITFKADASYLITGGFGGLGREVAQWMVAQGARNLVLVGRHGAGSEEGQDFVRMLERGGAKVLALAADVAREADVERLMGEVDQAMPPLKGLFHAAGILDDAALKDLDGERFHRVMRPKALGAWNLHRRTMDTPLDYFVLFSSISVQIGNIGQGAYVAANAFLDSLAHYRRARGLPAISINWGAIGQVGMVARDNQVEKYLRSVGSNLLTPAQAVYMLGKVLEWNPVQISIADVDVKRWAQVHSAWAESSRFSHLVRTEMQVSKGLGDDSWVDKIEQLQPHERHEQLTGLLAELICETMQLPVEKLDPRQPLIGVGLDSLMAMELQTAIEVKLGLRISILELMKGTSVAQFAENLLGRLNEATSGLSVAPGAPTEKVTELQSLTSVGLERGDDGGQIDAVQAERLLENLDELSEEEVDALLRTMEVNEVAL